MKHGRISTAGIALLLAATVGCGWLPKTNWTHPGPASYQQQKAVRFDPYPETDIGPPVVGGRPLGYTQPPSESARARKTRNHWWPWGAH
jgi:hypothetical protein